MPTKLLVINQYYAPDVASTGQLLAEICAGLARNGSDVHVVTGQPSYTTTATTAPSYEVLDGVHVHRVSLAGSLGRERLWVRLAGYLRFLWGAWQLARAVARKERTTDVLTAHNPPFVGFLGAWLARRFKMRYTYFLLDIHPDIIVAAGRMRYLRLVTTLWDHLHRRVLRQADAVIVLGEGMRRTLVDHKGVSPERVHIIPSWARPELSPSTGSQSVRSELGIEGDDLLVLYAGNMGIMHPLDPILDAAEQLRHTAVSFLFLGDGQRRLDMESRVKSSKLDRVTFLPFQPEERFAQLVAASDACLVALQPGMERYAVPSRAYTFLSAAKPLITIMSPGADIADLVDEARCGWNVTSAEQLSDLLLGLVGQSEELVERGGNARRLYEARFRRDLALAEYERILQGG